jgi:hypothetical protein
LGVDPHDFEIKGRHDVGARKRTADMARTAGLDHPENILADCNSRFL